MTFSSFSINSSHSGTNILICTCLQQNISSSTFSKHNNILVSAARFALKKKKRI